MLLPFLYKRPTSSENSQRTLACTRFRPWMQFFTSFISFTLSAAFNSVSLTVKWVFSFLAGAASSSAAWFHKGLEHKCVHFNAFFFYFYQYSVTVHIKHISFENQSPELQEPLPPPLASFPHPECSKFSASDPKRQMKRNSPPALRRQSDSQTTRQTLRSSLRSDTSNKVRLAMSLTSCWILGEYCLGAPSSGGVAMASEWVAGLVLSCLRAHRGGVCRWSCCLEYEEEDKPSKRTIKHHVCKSFTKYGQLRPQHYREV